MLVSNLRWPLPSWNGYVRDCGSRFPKRKRNGYIEAMKANKVPEWYIESCGKIKYMFPKAHAAAYVMMALRVAYFKVHHPIYYYCASLPIRAKAFDIKTMGAGLDAIKRRMEEISENGRTMKPLMWRLTSIQLLRLSMKCGNVVSSLGS